MWLTKAHTSQEAPTSTSGSSSLLSVFSIANAHPFKSEKELYDFYTEIDKKIFAEKNKPIVRKKFPRKLTKVKK